MKHVVWLFAFGLSLPASAQTIERIGLIGCYRQTEPQVALAEYVQLNPDLVLWVGDNVYVDTEDDPAQFHEAYGVLAAQPAFAELSRVADRMVTWDDHDFGDNNETRHYALKDTSKAIFRSFWELENVIPASRDGVYHARRFESEAGTLQVIMLDVRYNRDHPGPEADMLGEQQWVWLEEQLAQAADLRIIVSGTQILLSPESGSETWEDYPVARSRLLGIIRASGAEGVLFVTGDQHYAEVARDPDLLDVDVVEIQFATLNQIEDPEMSAYRVSPVARSRHTMGWIDIQWEDSEEDVAHLVYQVKDVESGQMEIIYRVNLAELNLHASISGNRVFWPTTEVTFEHEYADLTIDYSLDGESWRRVPDALTLDRTVDLQWRFVTREGLPRSYVRTERFERLEPLTPVSEEPYLRFAYYEGEFEQLPSFDVLEVLASGTATTLHPQVYAQRDDHYALLFEGVMEVEQTGLYTFEARSDDGSRVWIHDRLVVDNDGSHSARTREGRIALQAGRHPIRIAYFEDYAGQSLRVRYRIENGSWQNVGEH